MRANGSLLEVDTPGPPIPSANYTVRERMVVVVVVVVGSQTFLRLRKAAAGSSAKWPLGAGCSLGSRSMINAAGLAISAPPLHPSLSLHVVRPVRYDEKPKDKVVFRWGEGRSQVSLQNSGV